jgi:hypothetical protein
MELEASPIEDRAYGYTYAPAAASPRQLTLRITTDGAATRLTVVCDDERIRARFPALDVPLALDEPKLKGAIRACQAEWKKYVVSLHTKLPRLTADGKIERKYVFQKATCQPVNEGMYETILKKLATAGRKLFIAVFRPPGDAYKTTRDAAQALRELAEERDLWVTVESESFCAPWNLMYLGADPEADGGPVRLESFWGYQHIIEHDVCTAISPPAPYAPTLGVALHFDERLDESFKLVRGNDHLRKLFREYAVEGPVERNNREEFAAGLRQKRAREQIFYFCCHAKFDGSRDLSFERPRLLLTTRPSGQPAPIEPSDIDDWLDDWQCLEGRPLVFINGCEGAKMDSFFYKGFATTFLQHKAGAVVGPETEIPVMFARDFAIDFFREFFGGGPENNVGRVLARVRRRFMSRECRNPLGLVYSLYRGGGLYIDGPVPQPFPAPPANAGRS